MRATRKKLQEQSFAYILQNRCFKKSYQKETPTQVFFSEISKIFENIFFLQNTPVTTSEIKHILQLLIYYILEQKISIGMREP